MYDICALGEVLIDAIASADTCIQITGNAGGAPANVLTCGTRMGLKTAFLAKAGGDFIGNWLKGVLDEVGHRHGGHDSGPSKNTTIAMVSLDEAGNRSFSFYRIGCADVSLTKEELRLDLIEQSRIFHFGSVSMTEEPARSATLAAAAMPGKRAYSFPTIPICAGISGATSRPRQSTSKRALRSATWQSCRMKSAVSSTATKTSRRRAVRCCVTIRACGFCS